MATSLDQAIVSTGMIPPVSDTDLKSPEDKTKPDKKESEYSIIAQGSQAIGEDIKKLDATKPPEPPQFKEAPKATTSDPDGQAYVSAVGVLGAIGSIFTRRPMVNSMNSAAAVVSAMKSGDLEAYKQNFEKWKVDNENIKALSDYQQGIYKDILDNTKLGIDAKMGMLNAHAAAFKDDATLELTKNRDEVAVQQLMLDREKAQHTWEKEAQETQKLGIENQTKLEQLDMAKEDLKAGVITREQYSARVQSIATGKAITTQPTLSSKTIDFLADQALMGDKSVFTNMGRQASGAANITAVRERMQEKAEEQGLSPEELTRRGQEFAANTKGLGNITTRVSNIITAGASLGEVPTKDNPGSGAAKLVIDASKDVPSGKGVLLNKAENEWKIQTSDPKLAQLSVYLDTFAKEYASATNPNGKRTVSDTNKARENLSVALNESHAALVARVEAMVKEKNNSLQKAQEARKAFLTDEGETGSETGANDQPTEETPPMEGAKKAPDGNWYVEKEGKHYRIDP